MVEPKDIITIVVNARQKEVLTSELTADGAISFQQVLELASDILWLATSGPEYCIHGKLPECFW